MASNPLAAAMAAGSPPPAASRSASTALAWVAVSDSRGLHGQQGHVGVGVEPPGGVGVGGRLVGRAGQGQTRGHPGGHRR